MTYSVGNTCIKPKFS